jgi:stage V sporulation protein SpoVS
MRLILAVLALVMAACGSVTEPRQVAIQLIGAEGAPALIAATKITEKYYAEKRYERVVLPNETSIDESASRKAQEVAVVQPAFEESNPNGLVYIRCVIHEPVKSLADSMAVLCESQIREVAAQLHIALYPSAE